MRVLALGLLVAVAWIVNIIPADFASSSGPVLATSSPPTLISMQGGRLRESGTLRIDIVASAFPDGLTGFQLRVSTADPDIAVPFLYVAPDFGLTSLDATSTRDTISFAAVDLNSLAEPGAVDVVLGSVTFLGRGEGVTTIRLDILRMDDEGGFPILTSTGLGLLTVTNSRDLDGDGITEDVNGNGRFDFADVLMLFRMLLALPP